MKILFLVFHGFYAYNGICKKILAQADALKKLGHDVRMCYYNVREDGTREWKVDSCSIAVLGKGVQAKIRKRLDLSPILDYALKEKIELLYYRSFHNAGPVTTGLVRKLHDHGVRTLLEIPTYPYDGEYPAFSPKLLSDKLFRKSFCACFDRIVTFSEAERIFGRPTIRISNGIDFSRYPLRNPRKPDGTIRLLSVAEVHFWHGLDRLIEGMGTYYKKGGNRDIRLDIVGPIWSEREQNEIGTAIAKYALENRVSLKGPKFDEELDAAFREADLAIGSLGRHRSGITTIKTLKNREYAARGFRFIYSENDPDFDTMPYVCRFPADESPIDIDRLLEFFDSPAIDPSEIRETIMHLSWKAQMHIVIEEMSGKPA